MPTPHTTLRSTTRRYLAPALALTIILAACGGDDATDTSTTSAADDAVTETTLADAATTAPEVPLDTGGVPPADYAAFRAQQTACGAETPPEAATAEFSAPDDMAIDPDSRPVATLATSCGDIVIELDPSIAPETVNSFVFLAESGYFDGTAAHRIVPGFVLQAGDPTATGLGGPGYFVPDEPPPAEVGYERGVVAMANAGPDTTGSQFFIMLADGGLPPAYSVFGRVTEGLDVLDTIAAIPTGAGPSGEQSTPLQSVYLDTVTIAR